MIHQSILDTIGRTPVVKIHRLAPDHVSMYVKIEAFNPMASVKDRLAIAIIEDAERRGTLSPGQTVIEATSGNTGIALAMVCAAKGYPFVAVMAETFSMERRKIMQALGARLLITPKELRSTGMVQVAADLASENDWFLARQFENEANPEYHRQTTAAEILRDFAGQPLDYFVSGYGTGGTATGVGQVLRVARPETQIIGAEPAGAALLSGMDWQPHKVQGWTPDFIPPVMDRDVFHKVVPVDDDLGIATSRDLAAKEGIFVGISAGATFAAGLKVAESAAEGSAILVMLPDTGERYLSTPLFEHLSADSDPEVLGMVDFEARLAALG